MFWPRLPSTRFSFEAPRIPNSDLDIVCKHSCLPRECFKNKLVVSGAATGGGPGPQTSEIGPGARHGGEPRRGRGSREGTSLGVCLCVRHTPRGEARGFVRAVARVALQQTDAAEILAGQPAGLRALVQRSAVRINVMAVRVPWYLGLHD